MAYDFREVTPPVERDAPNAGEYEPIGTTHSQYAPPSEGPFECGNCEHFGASVNGTHGLCDHPDVVADAVAGEIKEQAGKALVAKGGCCSYFRKHNDE